MSVQKTLDERGSRYGDFTDHAEIAQRIQTAMRARPGEYEAVNSQGWMRLSDVQKQALTVIADKIARILSGDPNYADNWHDIQGYAKLVEDRLPKPEAAPVEDFISSWHIWDCQQPRADLGPKVPAGYYVCRIKTAGDGTYDMQPVDRAIWDASLVTEGRIIAYCLERLP